jgi:hypothetical protein
MLLALSGTTHAAEVLLPIQHDLPYNFHQGSRSAADLTFPLTTQCNIFNEVERCTVIKGGKEIETRGMGFGDVVFKSDKTFELKIEPKTNPAGKVVTEGGTIRGTFRQKDDLTITMTLDQASKQFSQLSIFPNLSEVVDYASTKPNSIGSFHSALQDMTGKLKLVDPNQNKYQLVLKLEQRYKSTKGNLVTVNHAFCTNKDCQAIAQVLK